MKANEIQIGDWVHYQVDLGKDGVYEEDIQVKNIYGNEINCEVRHYEIISGKRLCNCKPIPLTPDILEKNGFKKNKTGQWVIEKKHSIGCCGQTCSNTNPLEYAVWWDRFGLGCVSYLEKEGNMTLGGTTYVHQLQQVLRLFDLDEFIKIEL